MLLAEEMNRRMKDLLHGDERWLASVAAPKVLPPLHGGISSQEEEEQLKELNDWMKEMGLPQGELSHEYADPVTGEQVAIFDLAWPDGIQKELSQPVAVLLDESAKTITFASQAGFRCFASVEEFQQYVQTEVLSEGHSA